MKFVFDLDGTICFKGKPVSDKLLNGLEGLERQGHEVIFASARPIRDLLPVLHPRFHRHPMVGGNGSMAAQDGSVIAAESFDEATLTSIYHLLSEYEVSYLIDGVWDYAYTGPADHPIRNNLDPHRLANQVALGALWPVVKILLLTSQRMTELVERLKPLDVVVHVHGQEGVLDISPRGIDKWSGLKRLGVNKGEYIAFGNDANDISMFRYALHSVMIGHHELLAPYAAEMLPANADSGLELSITKKLQELGARYAGANL